MSGIQSQTQTNERAKAWTNYWQTGNLHSCLVTRSEGEEDVPVHDHDWRQFFGALEDGARILDVGTGNGAVAQLAYDTGKQGDKHFEVHGVDAAEISTAGPSDGETGEVHFHAAVPMESLPFEDDWFDCVVSQYALEYSDMEVSIIEAARVLKPGGRARFILHSQDSAPVQSSIQELGVLKDILDDMKLIRRLRKMFVMRAEEPAKAPLADRRVLNTIRKLEGLIENDRAIIHHADLFRIAVDLYNQRTSIARRDLLDQLNRMEIDYACLRERLTQMVGAALGNRELEVLQGILTAANFENVNTEHLINIDKTIGWLLELNKQA